MRKIAEQQQPRITTARQAQRAVYEAMQQELASRSFLEFCKYTSPEWKATRFHRFLTAVTDSAISGTGSQRLIVNTPFQVGKSTTITEKSAAYAIIQSLKPGTYLNKLLDGKPLRVILTAYDDTHAQRYSEANMNLALQYCKVMTGYEVALSPKRKAKDDWVLLYKNKKGKWKKAAEVLAKPLGGAINGTGSELLIIDDPHKDKYAARKGSAASEKCWQNYLQILRSRVAKGGIIMVVQSRLDTHDMSGRLLRHSEQILKDPTASPEDLMLADQWTHIKLKAICENTLTDPLHRQPGEGLLPELGLDGAYYRAQRLNMGSRVFEESCQQEPTEREGNIIKRKWIKRYIELPRTPDALTQSWDLTFGSTSETASYAVGQIWAKVGADHYLIYQWRKRCEFIEQIAAIKLMSKLYPQAVRKLVEKKANGAAALNVLRKTISGLVPITPGGDKTARTEAASVYFEGGNVYVPDELNPQHGQWVEEWIDEICDFPNGEADDQLDTATQYLNSQTRSGVAVGRVRA